MGPLPSCFHADKKRVKSEERTFLRVGCCAVAAVRSINVSAAIKISTPIWREERPGSVNQVFSPD